MSKTKSPRTFAPKLNNSFARRLLAHALIVLLYTQAIVPPALAYAAAPKAGGVAAHTGTPARVAETPTYSAQTLTPTSYGIVLTQVGTAFDAVVGLDYHQPTGKLVVSANSPAGQPNNFELIEADGTHRAFSNVSGMGGELKLAAARDEGQGLSLGGFKAGEVLTATATPGLVERIAPDGWAVQSAWVTLAGETGLVGGLNLDRTGVFGGDLIAVTSAGNVWRIKSTGTATKLASLNTPLSGVVTLPDDVDRYGPWAGKILAGAKAQGLVYAIDAQGGFSTFNVAAYPEDLRVVPAHENFYAVDPGAGKIWGAQAAAFTSMVGDVLVAQESPGTLTRVHWNGTEFESSVIASTASLKQIAFAPAGVAEIPAVRQVYEKIAVVRHAPSLDSGRVEGALWQLTAEPVTLDGTDTITSDLLVPGSPSVNVGGGRTSYGGTVAGTGSALPSGYAVNITGSAALRHVVTRTNPIPLSAIQSPPSPAGTRDVSLSQAGQSAGNFSTLRNLSLSGKAGEVSVPPGTYGGFAAAGHTALVLGVAGSTQPTVYNLESLTMSGGSELRVVGPVVLTVRGAVSLTGSTVGSGNDPRQLILQTVSGAVTVGGGAVLYAVVRAPQSALSIEGKGRVRGTVSCDRLNVAGNGVLQVTEGDLPAAPVNRYPTVDAGLDQTITLPTDTVSLSGSTSDDGLPEGGALTSVWTKVSGPGPVTFGNPASPSTTATFVEPGTYVLRLSANDTLLVSRDDVTVTVEPRNLPPVVNAGAEQTIELPATASLAGTVTDDALPRGSAVTVLWSKSSGPGDVNFSDPEATTTNAAFTAAGRYELTLTASDTELTSNSTVVVNVLPENHAPEVTASSEPFIALPSHATLAGTVTDDGLPAGATLTSLWTQAGGPGVVTFANATSPATNATFSAPGTYTLRLTATDTRLSASAEVTIEVDPENRPPTVEAGPAQTVELPAGATLNGVVNDDSYPRGSHVSQIWTKVSGPGEVTFADASSTQTAASFGAPGEYTLRLTATDTALTNSDEVVVNVYPENQPPQVNAGPDVTVRLPAAATLAGTVSDDGWPYQSTLTSLWTKASGPGEVTFADASSPQTTASFTTPGEYVLRLTANDTRASVSKEMKVTVLPANVGPTVSAGPDKTAQLDLNLLRNAGNESPLVENRIPFWGSPDSHAWTQAESGESPLPFSLEGGTYFYPATGTTTELQQDVDVSAFAASIDGGAQQFAFEGYVRAGVSVIPEGSRVVVEYRDAAGTVLASFDSGVITSPEWLRVADSRAAPSGTRTVRVRLFSKGEDPAVGLGLSNKFSRDGLRADHHEEAPAAAGALFDGLSLRALGAAAASLEGAATDDGLPAGSSLSIAWSKVSGPGEVKFNNPSSAATSAVFTQPGTYVLRVTANDSEFDAADEMTVTVTRANLPPVVSAGADGTATAGVAYNLSGAATDDGLPEGSTLTHVWTKASGPGTVSFGDANALATSATFELPGTYVLRLSASDSEYTFGDEVRVTVGAANVAPTVDAGADQTIHLPADATLSGSVSDDGLPRDAALTLTWANVSGPGEVTFADAHAAQTAASFSAPGSYVLRLSASDTQLTGTDELTVSVVAVNQPPTVSAGNAQTLTMPANTASLDGAVTDDGLPAGAGLTSRWSVVGAKSVPAPTGFADDFNDNSLNTSRWQVFDSFNGAQIVEQNQRLEFRPSTVTNSGVVLRTVGYTDLRGHTIVFKYGGHVGTSNPLTRVTVRDDVSTATVWMDIAPTSLQCYGDFYLDGFSRGDGTFAYDGSPFWIRFSQEGNSYKWETSPDGVNWVPRVSAAFPRSPTQYQYFKTSFNTSVGQPVIYLDDFAVSRPAWDKYAGPGNVTFADASSPTTTATFGDAGIYTLRLTGSDTEFTRAADVTVTVNPANHAPAVEAGTGQTILLTESAKLNGSAADEGLPLGAAVTTQWTKVSGPGNVSFADPSAPLTTATFSSAGYYVLRLSASDTQLTGTGDVLVKVVESYAGQPGGVFITGHDADDHALGIGQPAIGAQNIIKRAVEYVTYKKTNPRILFVTDLRNPGGDQADTRQGLRAGGYNTFDVADYGSGQEGALNLHNVNFSNYDVIVVASDYGGWLRQDELDILIARSAELIDYVNNGGGIVAFAESGGRAVPPGNYPGCTRDRFKFLPFVVSSEEFHEAETGIRVTPEGAATGLKDSDVNGNFSHNIFTTTGGMSVIDRDASNNILSLAVRGKHITSEGTSGNDAPIVSAGQNRTITLPHTTTLAGFVSDDGLPAGSTLNTLWRKISGPGNVNITSPDALQTEASFDAPGTYVLRFSASDGQLSSYSDVTVTVNPLGQYVVVSVGADQTIRLPKSASLSASVTDGRVSQAQPLTLQWTKVSGPGAVTFANPAALSTAASFGAPGVYVLRFSAGDPTYTGSDELTVSVRPAAGLLVDDFNDNTQDASKWYYGPGITEAGGQLQATLPNVAAFPEFQSVGSIDMTGEGAFIQMEVTDYGDPNFNNSQRYIFWRIQSSEGHWFQWVYNSGGIDLYLDNIRLGRFFGHPRHWRLIHYTANDRVNFDVSDDGSHWGTWYSLVGPYSFTLDNLIFRLIPGANGTNAAGTVKFDNVNSNLPQILPNKPPTPVTGGPYKGTSNVPVQFDGSGSTDPSDLIVKYEWEFGDGSTAAGATPVHTYASPGTYTVKLTVTDLDGATGSTTTTARILPPNQTPTVNAGADQTIRLPATAVLSGSASDDGLPEGAALSTQWTKVSGPGVVNFADPNSPDTTASFATDGTYVLRLTASDTELSASDELTVSVEAPPPNHAPEVSAGEDQTATPNLNLVRNAGGEEPVVGGVIPGWTKAEGSTWAQAPAGTAGFYESFEGDTYLHAPGDAHAELVQDIDLSNLGGSIKTGTQQFEFLVRLRVAAEAVPDSAKVIFEFRDALGGNVLATADTGEITTTEAWHLVEGPATAPAAARSLRVRLVATRNSGETTDAYFDAVSVRALVNAGVKLGGTLTDDGLPTGSTATAAWSVVSGPGAVSFENTDAASTSASFAAPGSYVLRLAGSDGVETRTDDVTVNVTEANQAPAVNAGIDQSITLPSTTAVAGSVNDDGLPQGRSVSVRWKKVAGPGTVTFVDANAAATNVSFSESGNYVLRLTADDSDRSTQDDLIVTVKAAPVNKAPTVEAGLNQTISLPGHASLAGQAADDGLPAGSSLAYTWSKVNGPGTVTFSNPNSLTTTAAFSAEGVYTLRLTVGDSQLSSTDELTVTVKPQGSNSAPNVSAGPDQEVRRPDAATLYGNATDDGLPNGSTLSVAWSVVSGPGAVSFANAAAPHTTATFDAAGTYVLRLTAGDSELTSTDDVTVTVYDQPTGDAPAVEILSPADGAEVTAPADVVGSVSGGAWRLEYAYVEDETAPAQGWHTFAAGSGAVTGGALGRLDPTLLLNGTYALRLSATDSAGRTTSDSLAVVVARQMKVGNFTVAFTDLSLPVAGIPVQVTRAYDSRDKRQGDFGVGWTLGITSARVQKTVPVGANWYETESFASLRTYCLESTRPQIVTITFGDGKVYKFQAVPSKKCQKFQPFSTVQMTFVPMAGTRGKLTPLNGGDILVAGSVPGPVDFVDINDPSGYYFNPSRFRLTTEDGTSFVLGQRTGVESVSIPSGETLTISPAGITHSSGASVVFVRDELGRVKEMRDPEGRSRFYDYDANGDLATFKDAEGNTTAFTYAADHYLKTMEVTSADGTRVSRPINNVWDGGRLVRQFDADGKEVVYEHDLAARREVIRDRLGNPTTYEYDERGNVVYTKDAEGAETWRSYDERDNVLTERTAEGTTTNVYDAADNLQQTTDPYGNVTKYGYDALKHVTAVTDPLDHVATSVYDEQSGNLLKVVDAEGNETRYAYEPLGSNVTLVTYVPKEDPAHPRYHGYTYNGAGQLAGESDGLGNSTSYTYDNNNNRKTKTVRRRRADGTTEELTTEFLYDRENRLTKTTYPDGSFAEVKYNELGKQSSARDKLGRETRYEYDSRGRLARTVFPGGRDEKTEYDDEGHRTSTTDRAGRVTAYKYDKVGRVTETLFPDGGKTTATYDALGRVLTRSRWLDATTKYTTTYRYEAEGKNRVVYVTDALAHTTKQTYDAAGRLWKVTDAKGHTTAYEYDKDNRRTKVVYHDNTSETTAYDGFGDVVAKTDQALRTTRFEYDAAGRLLKVKDAAGKETAYGYDELGRRVSQTDANSHATTYEYDAMGRRTKRTLPEGMSEVFTYDEAGRLKTRRDFNGKTTTYEYDDLNRLLKKTPDASFGVAPVTYTYTDAGRRETMTDATGTTSYTYDARDRLLTKQAPQGTLTYTYDKLGDLKTVRSSNAGGVSVDYAYDGLGRLSAAADNRLAEANTTAYAYDEVGNLESYTYGNNVKSLYHYDDLNRLTSLTISRAAVTLNGYAYTLGAAGNRESATEAGGRKAVYTYDDLYRLKSETITGDQQGANGAVSYTYDDVGNRLTRASTLPGVGDQSFTYDKNDRATSDTYDANGSTRQTQGAAYEYDWENRLASAGDGAVSYAYDGDGNRVAKTVGGVTTAYLVDTNNHTGYAQVVEELQGGQVVRQYTYGSDLISQRQLVAGQWSVSFYGYDGHGSVRFLTDAAGAVTDTYAYDAFGALVARAGSTPNDYLYAGERFDPETGLYHLRARYMQPETGRFRTMDSFEGAQNDPRSLHKYLYGDADPVNNIDPSGHMSMGEVMGTVGIITALSISKILPIAVMSLNLHDVPNAVGFAIYGAIADPTVSPVLTTWLSKWGVDAERLLGAEVIFSPSSKQMAVYGFAGVEGAVGPGGAPEHHEHLHGEVGGFESWYWRFHFGGEDPSFKFFGAGAKGLFVGGEPGNEPGEFAMLFGVSSNFDPGVFGVVGGTSMLVGPTELSQQQMVYEIGLSESAMSTVINSRLPVSAGQNLGSAAVNGAVAGYWAHNTYGRQ